MRSWFGEVILIFIKLWSDKKFLPLPLHYAKSPIDEGRVNLKFQWDIPRWCSVEMSMYDTAFFLILLNVSLLETTPREPYSCRQPLTCFSEFRQWNIDLATVLVQEKFIALLESISTLRILRSWDLLIESLHDPQLSIMIKLFIDYWLLKGQLKFLT